MTRKFSGVLIKGSPWSRYFDECGRGELKGGRGEGEIWAMIRHLRGGRPGTRDGGSFFSKETVSKEGNENHGVNGAGMG